MGGLIGFLIGAFFGCYLVYSLLHWALIKRVISDRFVSHIVAAIVTYPVSALLYGLGAADGGDFKLEGFVTYLVPALIVFAISFKVGRREQQKASDQAQGSVFQ